MARKSARAAAVQMVFENMLGGDGGEETLRGLIEFAPEENEPEKVPIHQRLFCQAEQPAIVPEPPKPEETGAAANAFLHESRVVSQPQTEEQKDEQ